MDTMIINQDKLRQLIKEKVGVRDNGMLKQSLIAIAEDIGLQYEYFTRWWNGQDVGVRALHKINKYLNNQ